MVHLCRYFNIENQLIKKGNLYIHLFYLNQINAEENASFGKEIYKLEFYGEPDSLDF